jgi:hypothetical protein
MKTPLFASALLLSAMTTATIAAEPADFAAAGPVELTEVQMDSVTAGQVTQEGLVNVGVHLEERAVNIPIDIEVRNVQVGVAALSSKVIQSIP